MTKPTWGPDAWTPVLKGAIYCSPACGGRCTQAAYDKAIEAADKLAASLGTGWKPRVWENLGWHYCIVSPNGCLKLHPSHGPGYTAFLGRPGSPGGTYAEHGKLPRTAIAKVKKLALEELAILTKMVEACS